MSLENLGFTAEHQKHYKPHEEQGLLAARVTREDRGGRYRVLAPPGDLAAETAGRLRNEARFGADLPAVGDFVALRPPAGDGPAMITAVLPRRSAFRRKAAGTTSEERVLAANVDVAFLVTGLDGDFRLRRIERYLTLAAESGAEPVVVLNKADVCDDPDLRVRQAEGVSPFAPVIAVSAARGEGIERLAARLGPGRTAVFLGSSGAGKSTLVNRLLGEELLSTGEVRASDSRGRHTTTRRELFLLPGDRGVVIDTPGLREIALAGGEEDVAGGFPEIEDFATDCRYRDCRHEGEPGCAIAEALADGRLDPARWESFLGQRRELAYQERRHDLRARQEEEARWRRIRMEFRKRQKSRGRAR